MTHDPSPTTDVFDWLAGDGFVMVGHHPSQEQIRNILGDQRVGVSAPIRREVWTDIKDDVAELEALLR